MNRFEILAFVGERFVLEAVLKLAVKNDALLMHGFYIQALVDDSVVWYAIAPDRFAIQAFVIC